MIGVLQNITVNLGVFMLYVESVESIINQLQWFVEENFPKEVILMKIQSSKELIKKLEEIDNE